MEGLKEMKGTGGDQEKVKEILKRVYSEQDVPESEMTDLAERLDGLDFDCDSEVIWSKLTANEKSDFKAMIRDGRMGYLIEQWQPWWTSHAKVVEIKEEEKHNVKVPLVLEEIKDISKLLKLKEPAEDIKYNVVNILFGYTYLCRFYNGEIFDNVSNFVRDLYLLCGSFQAEIYHSTSEAVQACLSKVQQNSSLVVSPSFALIIIRDTGEVVGGPMANSLDYMMAAMSDIYRAVDVVQQPLSELIGDTGSRENKELKKNRQTLFATKKKVEFLLSWIVKYGIELKICIAELEMLYCEMSSELNMQKQAEVVAHKLKEQNKGKTCPTKPLIEELN